MSTPLPEFLSLTDQKYAPPAFAGAIMKALEAAQRGHEAALAALAGRGNPGAPETAAGTPPEGAGKPEVTGLLRAREAVAAGFQHRVAALNEALTQVPEQPRGASRQPWSGSRSTSRRCWRSSRPVDRGRAARAPGGGRAAGASRAPRAAGEAGETGTP